MRCVQRDSHLHGAFRTQVALQHVLEPAGRADVDRKGGMGAGHFGFRVQGLYGRHGGAGEPATERCSAGRESRLLGLGGSRKGRDLPEASTTCFWSRP